MIEFYCLRTLREKMIPGLYKICPQLPTHRQVFCKTMFCTLRNLFTHFNPYSTCVAIRQQGLENLKNNFLTHVSWVLKSFKYLRLKVVESGICRNIGIARFSDFSFFGGQQKAILVS